MYCWSIVKKVKLETKLNLVFQKIFNFVSKKSSKDKKSIQLMCSKIVAWSGTKSFSAFNSC